MAQHEESPPPWSVPGDVLGRRACADYLTKYLTGLYSADQKTFVLAVDGDWGSGKSYLLRNWAEDLRGQGYPTILLDVWGTDFSDDPMLAFISELEPQLQKFRPAAHKRIHSLTSAAKKVAVPLLKASASVAVNYALGLSLSRVQANVVAAIKSGGDDAIKALLEKSFEAHQDKREAVRKLKDALEALTSVLEKMPGTKLPLFVLVDELDRCRPDYAVEFLECVKHFFDVPGVYFVLAVNAKELTHSLSAVYGDKFDGHRYLQRFIRQQYHLPDPGLNEFVEQRFMNFGIANILKELANQYSIHAMFSDFEDIQYEPRQRVINSIALQCKAFQLTLRDVDQLLTIFRAVLTTWRGGARSPIYIHFLIFLVIIKLRNIDKSEWSGMTWQEIEKNLPSMELGWRAIGNQKGDYKTIFAVFLHVSMMNNNEIKEYQQRLNNQQGEDSLMRWVVLTICSDHSSIVKYQELIDLAGQLMKS